MRRLIRRWHRALMPLRREDRGAIGALVAVLVGGGVLVAMGALVVDVGRLYQERAELQNGADAAALAVAQSCAAGNCTPGIAATYADANSSHGLQAVDLVCGSGGLGDCPASTGKPTDCPPPPAAGNYVNVHTSTQTSGGTVIPSVFARALLGNENYQGTTVYACAQASWGGLSSANTAAFTISACAWDQATAQGTSFAPPPPYPPNALPSPSLDRALSLKGSGTATGCPTEPNGSDGPGIFGWTDDQTGTCGLSVTSGTYGADPGVSAGQSCKQLLASAQANRTVIYLPVYTSLALTGNNGTFTLKGFAAFVVTGYHLPGFTASDWLNPANDCTRSNECINGYFTQALVSSGGTAGGTDLGLTIVQLSG